MNLLICKSSNFSFTSYNYGHRHESINVHIYLLIPYKTYPAMNLIVYPWHIKMECLYCWLYIVQPTTQASVPLPKNANIKTRRCTQIAIQSVGGSRKSKTTKTWLPVTTKTRRNWTKTTQIWLVGNFHSDRLFETSLFTGLTVMLVVVLPSAL